MSILDLFPVFTDPAGIAKDEPVLVCVGETNEFRKDRVEIFLELGSCSLPLLC